MLERRSTSVNGKMAVGLWQGTACSGKALVVKFLRKCPSAIPASAVLSANSRNAQPHSSKQPCTPPCTVRSALRSPSKLNFRGFPGDWWTLRTLLAQIRAKNSSLAGCSWPGGAELRPRLYCRGEQPMALLKALLKALSDL